MGRIARKRDLTIKKEDFCPRCLSRLSIFEDVKTGQTTLWCGKCHMFPNGKVL